MAAEQLPTIWSALAANAGTIFAVLVPQLVAILAAWIRIERRLARLAPIVEMNLHNTQAKQRHQDTAISVLQTRSSAHRNNGHG